MRDCSHHAARKYLPSGEERHGVALCLGGSGYRAALFHLGVLRRLNEIGVLGEVETICAVSGGSLVAGMLARGWTQLKSTGKVLVNFEDLVAAPIEQFVGRALRLDGMWFERLRPRNWSKLRRGEFTSTDLLAGVLDRRLFRGMPLASLTSRPRFVFGASNLRTGGRWEFRRDGIGEPLLGYRPSESVSLAQAVAASMASTVQIGPLLLRSDPGEFEGGLMGPRGHSLRRLAALADGHLTDALAIEPAWRTHRIVISSDGGQVCPLVPNYRDWFGARILRCLEIQTEQLAERSKHWLVSSLLAGQFGGAYISLTAYHGNYGLMGSVGYPADVVEEIRHLRTDLDAFSREETMTLVNHGYSLAETALRRYVPDLRAAAAPVELPYPNFIDRSKVLEAIAENIRDGHRRAA
jgi:NTE family protein